jgi:hypothetical protein
MVSEAQKASRNDARQYSHRRTDIVAIRKGERWLCQNPLCRSEILVTTSSRVQGGSKPRCSCGEFMKKAYVRPELSTFESAKQADRDFEPSPS